MELPLDAVFEILSRSALPAWLALRRASREGRQAVDDAASREGLRAASPASTGRRAPVSPRDATAALCAPPGPGARPVPRGAWRLLPGADAWPDGARAVCLDDPALLALRRARGRADVAPAALWGWGADAAAPDAAAPAAAAPDAVPPAVPPAAGPAAGPGPGAEAAVASRALRSWRLLLRWAAEPGAAGAGAGAGAGARAERRGRALSAALALACLHGWGAGVDAMLAETGTLPTTPPAPRGARPAPGAGRPPAAGPSPLHWAAEAGHAPVVAALLRHGADANARDAALGRTPLHRAAREGRLDVVRLLLSTPGVDVAARDRDGATALATARSFRGRAEVAAALAAAEAAAGRAGPAAADGTGDAEVGP